MKRSLYESRSDAVKGTIFQICIGLILLLVCLGTHLLWLIEDQSISVVRELDSITFDDIEIADVSVSISSNEHQNNRSDTVDFSEDNQIEDTNRIVLPDSGMHIENEILNDTTGDRFADNYLSRINQVFGKKILSYAYTDTNLNVTNDRRIVFSLEGERYGECSIYGTENGSKTDLYVDSVDVSILYSDNESETSDVFCSVVEGAFGINSSLFSKEIYNGCRYWEENQGWDIYISDTISGYIYGDSGYIYLHLDKGNHSLETAGDEEGLADDPGYYVGTLTVVNCEEWVSLREYPDTTSARLEEVPKWAEVDAYYYNHEWYACFYDGQFGYILSDYLTDWPEKYVGYYGE